MPTPNPLTYNAFITQTALMAAYQVQTVGGVVQFVEPNAQAIVPEMLNYSELRIQRDCSLLPALTSRTYTLSSNTLTLPVGDFVTIETMQANGSPLQPVSKEYLQSVWPTGATGTGQPRVFAMVGGDQSGGNTSNILMVGPPPDTSYPVTIFGMQRLGSLYQYANPAQANSQTTFISAWLPDLLVMAAMIYVSGFQRNFGRASDDPTMAMSYEAQYKALLEGAVVEEARKRFQSGAWASEAPTPVATPSR